MTIDTMGLPGPNTHVQWHYMPWTCRWRRMKQGDSTSLKATPGWERKRQLLDYHPVTGAPFPNGKKQWWICEIKLEN